MKKKITALILLGCLLLSAVCGCMFSERNIVSKDLTDYEITAELNESDMTVKAVEKVSYLVKGENTMKEMVFNLPPNGFRKDAKFPAVAPADKNQAYPNGEDYGGINIDGVKVKGSPVRFAVGGEDENALSITLPEEFFPNDRCEIEIEFTVKLANVKHRLGYTDHAVNLGNWFPTAAVYENGEFKSYPYYSNGDPFYTECANFEIALTLPSEYTVASSGVLTDRKASEQTQTVRYGLKCARDFAMVLGKNFKCIQDEVDGVDLFYYYYDDSDMTESMAAAEAAVSTFSDLYGAYGYDSLSVVQTDFNQGGMEYPGLVYIASDVYPKNAKEVIVHETAHQWWYAMVGNNEVEESWLDEGLAEYSTALFYEKNPVYGKSKKDFTANALRNYRGYLSMAEEFSVTPNTVMNRSLKEFNTELEYVAMTYSKGCLLFEDLNRVIGDKKFFQCMKEYFEENKYKIATADSLVGAFEKVTAVNYRSFIDGYLEGKIKL